MPEDKKEKEVGENKDINIKIDIESLSKTLTDNLKESLESILAKEDLSKEAMVDAVVAVISGDIEKMQKSMQEQISKSLADVQKELDEKFSKSQEVNKEFDESLEMNGITFNKSEVGSKAFAAIKASFTEQQKLRKEIEFSKMIVRVEKEYPNVAGKPEEKAALLEVLEKSNETVKKIGLSMLQALNSAGGEFKKEVGSSHSGRSGDVQKLATDSEASLKLQKMAEDLAKKDNISVAKAWNMVVDTPEGDRLYEEHLDFLNKE